METTKRTPRVEVSSRRSKDGFCGTVRDAMLGDVLHETAPQPGRFEAEQLAAKYATERAWPIKREVD